VGHKILEVGREEVFFVWLPLVIRLSAKSEPLRTSSSISDAKAKSLTLRHPMNNSHVADPSQALYTIPIQNPEIGRAIGSKLDVREPAQPMKDERHWRVDSST
jgi:hypothetical protein